MKNLTDEQAMEVIVKNLVEFMNRTIAEVGDDEMSQKYVEYLVFQIVADKVKSDHGLEAYQGYLAEQKRQLFNSFEGGE